MWKILTKRLRADPPGSRPDPYQRTERKGSCREPRLLRELQENYGNQVQLLAGSGINADNVKALLEETGLTQVHSSCRDWNRDETTKGPWVNYCFAPAPHENDYDAVNETLVRKLAGSV